MDDLKSIYSELIEEHRSWLKPFGNQYLNKWENLLKSQLEPAICEAAARKLLSDYKVKVKPHEDISNGGPDFLCTKDGKSFYVEVTCITIEKVSQKTTLDDGSGGAQYYALLTKVFLGELCNKTPQCSNSDKPCIVAIGTLHFRAGCCCFGKHAAEDLLTGTPQISMKLDPNQGRAIGDVYEITDLRDSAFIRFHKTSKGQIECARNPISAVLLCNFRSSPASAVGILHPNPNHSFDRNLLSKIEFGKLVEGCQQTDQLSVEWI